MIQMRSVQVPEFCAVIAQLSMYSDGASVRRVEHPTVFHPDIAMRSQAKRAVQPAEAMTALQTDIAPLKLTTIHPVHLAAWIRDANGKLVPFAGSGRICDLALERQFFENAVAHEFLVQINLGAQARRANMEKNAPTFEVFRNLNLTPPP